MLPLLMMRHRRIPRSKWRDCETTSGKHWIEQVSPSPYLYSRQAEILHWLGRPPPRKILALDDWLSPGSGSVFAWNGYDSGATEESHQYRSRYSGYEDTRGQSTVIVYWISATQGKRPPSPSQLWLNFPIPADTFGAGGYHPTTDTNWCTSEAVYRPGSQIIVCSSNWTNFCVRLGSTRIWRR